MVLENFQKFEYPEEQTNSRKIMYLHGVEKGAQTGSLLGLGIGAIYGFIKKKPIFLAATKGSGVGIVVGSLLVMPMIAGRMHGRSEIEWQDRAWRLQRNQGQLRADYSSNIGGLLGVAIGPLLFKVPILSGAGLGSAVGVLGSIMYGTL